MADETQEAINKYLFHSEVYVVKSVDGDIIAVFCLYKVTDVIVEIKNIAVVEEYQDRDIGTMMITYVKDLCKQHYLYLLVGTPHCGLRQINFYEKNGFVRFMIKKDFYIKTYPEPIIENGVQLKNMLVLKYYL